MESKITWRTPSAVKVVDEAYLLDSRGQTDAGVKVLDTYLATEGGNPWVAATAGNLLRMASRSMEAIERFDQAISVQPDSAHTLAYRGECHSELGRPRTALSDYERALYLGISDQELRLALCDSVARIYAFLNADSLNPSFSYKATMYEAVAHTSLREIDAKKAQEISTLLQGLGDAIWEPCREYAGLGLGCVLDDALLHLVRLRPSATEAWAPFDNHLGFTLYTELGVLRTAKATRSVKLDGQEIISMEPEDLLRLLGNPSSTGVERGDPYVEYLDAGATFFFRDGVVVEALLSDS